MQFDNRRCRFSSPSEQMVNLGARLPQNYPFTRPFREVTCHAESLGRKTMPAPCEATPQHACATFVPELGHALERYEGGNCVIEIFESHSLIRPIFTILLNDQPIFAGNALTASYFYDVQDRDKALRMVHKAVLAIAGALDLALVAAPLRETVVVNTPYFEELTKS